MAVPKVTSEFEIPDSVTWALQMLVQYLEDRKNLQHTEKKLAKLIETTTDQDEKTEAEVNKRIVSSMVRDMGLSIVEISRYVKLDTDLKQEIENIRKEIYRNKNRVVRWDNAWLSALSDTSSSVEEEAIARIEGEGPVEPKGLPENLTLDLQLPAKQRQIVELIADGHSYGETAQILGQKKGSVSRQLRLARRKIKNQPVQLAFIFEWGDHAKRIQKK